MEKIKAKVENVLHKDKDTTTTTSSHSTAAAPHSTTSGTHNSHGVASDSGLRGDPTGPHSHVGNTASNTNSTYGTQPTHGAAGANALGGDPSGHHQSHLSNKVNPTSGTAAPGYSEHSGYDTTTPAAGAPTSQGLTSQRQAGHGLDHSSGVGAEYGSGRLSSGSNASPAVPSNTHSTHTGQHGAGGLHTTPGAYGTQDAHGHGFANQGITTGGNPAHTGSGIAGTTGGYSDPSGPHETRIGNKLDPTIDANHPGGIGNAASIGATHHTGHGQGLSQTSGAYDSGAGTYGSGGLTGGSTASPAVTSNTQSTHTGQHGVADLQTTPGHASSTQAPHKSNILNKLDPRVESSSKTH